ncbi:MAG: glutamate carboxypeptidase [Cyanobacteriota bacterium]|nr:glutamate carboxypeptidase [Cyanobacteriota bacterium]
MSTSLGLVLTTMPAVSKTADGRHPSAAREVGVTNTSSQHTADPALLREAQAGQANVVRDMATLVNIDTGTGDAIGLAKVGDILAQRLRSLGAVVQQLPAPPAIGKVVEGTFQGTGTQNIMLMIHYDTVFEKGEAAKRPFRIDGTKAFGPGVADAKGGIALILEALEISRKRGFKGYKTLTVLFNPDEEKSSLGSRNIIKTRSAHQDYVLSYEPPDSERVIVATNGLAHVHLNVIGVASHAGSAPDKGRNAALELAEQVMQLSTLGAPAKGTTVNWTKLQSGERLNMIPDRASATADMRMSDLGEIDRVLKDANRIIQKRFVPDTQVTVSVESRRPPFSRNPQSDRLAVLAQRVYQELGKSIEPVPMGFGTDAGFAYHPGSAKPVVLEGLGIVGADLHSPNEWVDLNSVVPRLYLTVRLLELLATPNANPSGQD